MTPKKHLATSRRGVGENLLNILVSEFEIQSRNYVHFRLILKEKA